MARAQAPLRSVVVVGAGAGGLAAAIDLARRGIEVTLLERSATWGGKIRQETIDGAGLDVGPTVFTMRWVFDALFDDAGASLDDALGLSPADLLARHAWRAGGRLDLFADVDATTDAIGAFAGAAEAQGYAAFCKQSRKVFETLRKGFIEDQRPSQLDVVRRVGPLNLPGFLATIRPFATLWSELGRYFKDPRLRQLFARYATYVGSSPFETPSTIMLVAHVEQDGVWAINGGMRALADAMGDLARRLGVEVRFGAAVTEILSEGGRAAGVRLADGEEVRADAVVFNGDIAALRAGLLGPGGQAAAGRAPPSRSLSAVTWAARARATGVALAPQAVVVAGFYRAEFDAIFRERRIVDAPTVYVCAQDRGEAAAAALNGDGRERLFFLINAPADGEVRAYADNDVDALRDRAFGLLGECGLELDFNGAGPIVSTPTDFDARFPATGGALYGQPCHGAYSTLGRPGARTRMAGLYLAGGSVHPGPGVPMATLSGRLAAAQCVADAGG